VLSGLALGAVSASAVRAVDVRIEDVSDKALQDALYFVQNGKLPEAEAAFSAYIELKPETASAWSNRGQTRADQGRFSEAAADFGRAISLAPFAPVPYVNRATALCRLYEQQGGINLQLLTDARIDCLEAVKVDPTEETAYAALGEIWRLDALRSDDRNFVVLKWRQSADAYREASEAAPLVVFFPLRRHGALRGRRRCRGNAAAHGARVEEPGLRRGQQCLGCSCRELRRAECRRGCDVACATLR